MNQKKIQSLCAALLLGLVGSAQADFELSDPQGRRILLKDNGTWSYVDVKAAATGKTDAKPEIKPEETAELLLNGRVDAPGGCRFDLTLTNLLPYEISSLVPDFSVYRNNNVVYATKILGFNSIKPGNKLRRELQFEAISCAEIGRLQVRGGDRCEMGALNKFSDVKPGSCLALLRVLPSELLKFEK